IPPQAWTVWAVTLNPYCSEKLRYCPEAFSPNNLLNTPGSALQVWNEMAQIRAPDGSVVNGKINGAYAMNQWMHPAIVDEDANLVDADDTGLSFPTNAPVEAT